MNKHFWKIKFNPPLFFLLLFILPSLVVLEVSVQEVETEREKENGKLNVQD